MKPYKELQKYELWFYEYKDKNFSELEKSYIVFTGSRSECYKVRKNKRFFKQYKVHKNLTLNK